MPPLSSSTLTALSVGDKKTFPSQVKFNAYWKKPALEGIRVRRPAFPSDIKIAANPLLGSLGVGALVVDGSLKAYPQPAGEGKASHHGNGGY
jgi:hypothetical protein